MLPSQILVRVNCMEYLDVKLLIFYYNSLFYYIITVVGNM
nr:MAG TPA: hypothetical protein [Caudoviricetes sp.]